MTIDQIIYDTLRNDATVASVAGTRVYADWDTTPEDPNADVNPYIVFRLESETEVATMEPPSSSHVWYQSRFGLFCVAASAENKVALANAVKAALRPVRGLYTDRYVHDVVFSGSNDESADELTLAGIRIRSVFYEFVHSAA